MVGRPNRPDEVTVMRLATALFLAAFGWLALWATPAHAEKSLSPEMRVIEVDEKRGTFLDPDLEFVDHTGKSVRLGEYLDGERPVLLTLNYYRCKVVCSVQLNGLADALAKLEWTPGDENFRAVTISIDPEETPADARAKREMLVEALGRGPDVSWSLLTGKELDIRALAAQLGIHYAYDAEQDQYAHPAVAMFITPDGKIVQYVYGLTFDSRDLKLALLDAGEGKIGTPMEKLYQSCFTYDPTRGQYGPFAFGIMRIGGGLTAILVLGVLVFFWRRERRGRPSHTKGSERDTPHRRNAEALS